MLIRSFRPRLSGWMSVEERSGMKQKRCRGCHKLFHPRAQCPGQQFCSATACQRERKRRWQKARRATDADYRDNDIRANHQWRRQHPDYWRSYRRQHPRAVMRNRDQQRQRDQAKRVRPAPAAVERAISDPGSICCRRAQETQPRAWRKPSSPTSDDASQLSPTRLSCRHRTGPEVRSVRPAVAGTSHSGTGRR